eukprot:289173-Chlamydomonas_euryale.AAC.1
MISHCCNGLVDLAKLCHLPRRRPPPATSVGDLLSRGVRAQQQLSLTWEELGRDAGAAAARRSAGGAS